MPGVLRGVLSLVASPSKFGEWAVVNLYLYDYRLPAGFCYGYIGTLGFA